MLAALGLPLFICVASSMWGGMHYLAFINLRAAGLSGQWLAPVLWILALLMPVARILTLRFRNALTRILWWTAAVWMGLVFLLSFWFLAAGALRSVFQWTGWFSADPRAWALGTALAVLAMGLWGVFRAARGPREVHYALDRSGRYGLGQERRLVQISDVHLGLT